MFEVDTRRLLAAARVHHDEAIRAITFDSSGEWLFTGGSDRRIKCWRWRTTEAPRVIGLNARGIPDCLTLTRDGRTLLTGSSHGQVTLWNVHVGQELFPLVNSGSRFKRVLLSRDNRRIVAVDERGEISLLEIIWGPDRDEIPP